MAFLTASEFLDFYDARTVAGRLLDDGRDAAAIDMLDSTSTAGRRLALVVQVGEERVLAAVRVGNRYTVLELQALVDGGTAGLLKSLIAHVAFGELLKRRALPADKFAALAPAYAEAEDYLQLLREGNRIFDDVPNVPEAGLPADIDIRTRTGIDDPSLVDNHRLFGVLSPSVRPGLSGGNWS